jgi:hypothetical protein
MSERYIGFHETMSGHYAGQFMGRNRFEFTVDASAKLKEFVNPDSDRFMLTDLEGVVNMDGVCNNAEMQGGTLLLDLFNNQQLVYDFKFDTDRGIFLYHGVKNLSIRAPLESMTTLYGAILNQDEPESYLSECRFDLKDLPQFLWSFYTGLKRK